MTERICKDDLRFVVLCQRFGGDCEGNRGLAKSLQKHCAKTCKLCWVSFLFGWNIP